MNVLWLLLAILGALLTVGSSEEREDLCLVVLGPYPDLSDTPGLRPGWDGGPALIPAARLAAEVLNNRTDVLSSYRLRLLEGDSGCDVESKAVVSLASTAFHRSSELSCAAVAGVVGPACTGAGIVVGGLLGKDASSLLHVSPSATSPELADTDLYPNTFRMLSSSMEYVELYRELMQYNGWNDVAALYDPTRKYFLSTFHEFRDSVNVTYFCPVSMNKVPLEDIHAAYKIIVVFVGAELARNILCLAHHTHPTLKYPIYQWIFHDKTEDQLWQNVTFSYAGNVYTCSKHQMMQATEGVILNVYRLKRENELSETDVGLTLRDFHLRYRQELSKHLEEIHLSRGQYTPTAEDWAPLYYDAVWTMALALDRAEPELIQLENLTLSEYKYGYPQATAIVKQKLLSLDFEGLSGRVVFQNETRDVASIIEIYQIIYDSSTATSTLIGYYGSDGLVVYPAADFVSGSFEIVQEHVHPAATVIFCALVFLCTGFLATLHILYIYHGNSSAIRASSPRLSQLIFSGCYLVMCLAFVLALVTSKWMVTLFEPLSHNHFVTYGVFCCVSNWNISLGYTLILSSLVVQLWRIYNIFNHFRKELRFLSDEWLVCIVGGLVALNCTVQLVWILTDPQLPLFRILDVVESYGGSQHPITPLRFICHSETGRIYDSIIISINGLLAVSLIALSILNRQVKKKNFINSGVSVFVYVFIIITLFASFLTTSIGAGDLLFVVMLWEFCFISSVFTVSLFLFLPRVREACASNSLCGQYIFVSLSS